MKMDMKTAESLIKNNPCRKHYLPLLEIKMIFKDKTAEKTIRHVEYNLHMDFLRKILNECRKRHLTGKGDASGKTMIFSFDDYEEFKKASEYMQEYFKD